MKSLSIALIVGLILLYFVVAAFKIDLFNWEMIIHSGIRFFTGFIIIGIGYFRLRKLTFKISIILVLALVFGDDILDYFRDTTNFSVESILYGMFMLVWGSVVGYLFMRSINNKDYEPL